MALRNLTRDDADEAVAFVRMAAFPPGGELPPDALEMPHARRWLVGWDEELGIGWEHEGQLVAAAWARPVEPVLARDEATGEPLDEVIIAVAEEARGAGLGRRVLEALLCRASRAGRRGLVLTVSDRNSVAVRLYERVGFAHHARTPTGSLIMVWRAPTSATAAELSSPLADPGGDAARREGR
ncbi:MAG TPA: GNAT family N-acetyltransferase [Solirubrobacteraceae bacterium]|nr:GNAT family N-acetyltransferase [Solirubrobacteraceae bacterium]